MTFHVGQKVVCVDASTTSTLGKRFELVKWKVYEVRWAGDHFYPEVGQYYGVRLVGLIRTFGTRGDLPFYASRFRPVVERKTSIELFHQIRRDVENNVPAELVGERA